MKPLDKTELRKRLEREGRWKAFVAAREGLVKERGLSRQEAWDEASKDFAKPLELIEPSVVEKRVEREAVKAAKREERVRERLDGDKLSDEPRPKLDGKKWAAEALDYRRDMDFVCRNLFVDKPDYESAPSAWAAGLLWRARTSRAMQESFVKEALSKLTPGKWELERAASAAVDDGRKQLEHVETLEKISRRVLGVRYGAGKGEAGGSPGSSRSMTLAEVRAIPGLADQGMRGENLAMVEEVAVGVKEEVEGPSDV